MANIVLGLGTSHTPMLLVDAADLPKYEENDRRLPLLDTDGEPTTFDALLARAGDSPFSADQLSARHAEAQRAISHLAETLASARLDALIIIGDDQQEMMKGDHHPTLTIYDHPTIRSQRPPPASNRPEWAVRGSSRYYPADGPRDYPVAQDLARQVTRQLQRHGLNAQAFPVDNVPMGHAFAFVHSQIMTGTPIPVVPVMLNAMHPPNQPTPAQCLEIGEAIGTAVADFPGNARVGIIASGGLSHFVVDEALDREVIRALTDRDHGSLAELPVHKLNSGSAEIRSWICAAAAVRKLRVERIDYIPGYRTRAGTGTGLCFATWQ